MNSQEYQYFKNRKDWRNWLKKNHIIKNEVWLLYYKKHTGKPTIPYDDAVEEALCFGWIDGKVKRIDDEKYKQRYTPRRLNSVWSQHNIQRVKKMIQQGKMTKIGLEKYEYALEHNTIAPLTKDLPPTPKDLIAALKKVPIAEKNFNKAPPSTKLNYIYWINRAKHNDTRKRRIQQTVVMFK
jgi:uncharacterized protein YdeI (YjbR/CyaY-like superfamily)